jgi:hypothetical protein
MTQKKNHAVKALLVSSNISLLTLSTISMKIVITYHQQSQKVVKISAQKQFYKQNQSLLNRNNNSHNKTSQIQNYHPPSLPPN